MTWFVLALFSVVFLALAKISLKVFLNDDKSDPIAAAILFQLLGSIIVGIVAFFHGFVMPPFADYPINYLLATLLWGMATFCLFKTYQYIEASEAAIITAFEGVVTVITSLLFLGETFNFLKLIGTSLIIFSVIYISNSSHKITFNKGVFFALAYCLFGGSGIANDAYMFHRTDPLSYLTVGFFLPAIFMILVRHNAVKKMKQIIRPPLFFKHFLFTFLYSIAAIIFTYSIVSGAAASQIGPISQAAVILTVILATVFLKERDHLWKKFISAVLVTIGVFLLK